MIKRKGDFIQLEDGTWAIDKRVKIDNEWKHFRKKGYQTLYQAKADLSDAEQEFIDKHSKPKVSTNTFDDLIEKYKIKRKRTVNESTLGCDTSIYNVYLYPYFKGKDIDDVFTEDVIQEWYDSIIDSTKYSQNKKYKVISRFKDIIDFAWEKKIITSEQHQDCKSCLYQVKCNKNPKTERVIWTDDEERNFLNATKVNDLDYLMFKTFLITGARIGEFLALQVKSFDYNKRKLKIEQQLKIISGKGVVLSDELKTHESYRTISLPKDLCDILKDYIETIGLKEEDFLFHSNENRIPLSRTSFRRKLYHYCDVANVRKCNPHAVRHQMAVKLSSVAETMQELEICAKRLGHSPEMFLNTYANHLNEDRESELLDRIFNA